MQNKQYNNVCLNSYHSSPVKPAKNAKMKKEKLLMDKIFFHPYKY
jgi:hypothetical protein